MGYDGYIAMDGNKLSICLFYKSSKGVNRAISRIEAMDGHVDQVGDYEVGGTISVDQIEEALKLIRVSKVPLTNPRGNPAWAKQPIPECASAPELTQTPVPVPQHPENANSGLGPACVSIEPEATS